MHIYTKMFDSQNTEISLREGFVAGDKEAYAALYRIYHPLLFNYGHKFTPNTSLVEDSIQEIFIHFWINRNKLAGVLSFKSYLFVSFRYRLLKELQKVDKNAYVFLEEEEYVFALDVSIDQVLIDKEQLYEQHIDLKNALERLTGRQKEAIYFLFYENLSYEEVATILTISKKVTYKLVARALDNLRALYKQRIALRFP